MNVNFSQNSSLFDVEGSMSSVSADVAELELEVETPSETDEGETELPVVTEDEETDETEEEDKEPSDEEEEKEEEQSSSTYHPFERPSIKELNTAFPELFKKFPSLKDMYFREAEFTKVFPTVSDAKEAAENTTAFTNIRDDIFNGDGSKFVTAMKEANEKGLERFAGKLLPNLVKISPNAFFRAANPLVEDVCRQMFTKGEKESDENMQNAARYLSKFFFDNVEIAEGKKTSIVKDEETSEVAKERETWDREKHTAFRGTVENDIKTQLLGIILSKDKNGKSRLDPDDVLTPFIKATIIDYIIKDLGGQLTADKDHIRYMDSLWDSAKKNGRTDADKARLVSAYLARAKAIIPTLRSKYVSEALGKKVKAEGNKKGKLEQISSRAPVNGSGRSSGSKDKGYNPKSIDYSKTSDMDLLNDNVKYK